jgi:hypothetical protein
MAMLVCLRLQNSEVVLCLDVYMDAIFLFMTMLVCRRPPNSEAVLCLIDISVDSDSACTMFQMCYLSWIFIDATIYVIQRTS